MLLEFGKNIGNTVWNVCNPRKWFLPIFHSYFRPSNTRMEIRVLKFPVSDHSSLELDRNRAYMWYSIRKWWWPFPLCTCSSLPKFVYLCSNFCTNSSVKSSEATHEMLLGLAHMPQHLMTCARYTQDKSSSGNYLQHWCPLSAVKSIITKMDCNGLKCDHSLSQITEKQTLEVQIKFNSDLVTQKIWFLLRRTTGTIIDLW